MRNGFFDLWWVAKVLAGLVLWLTLIYGALKVGDLPGDWNVHAFCGAWGCLPQPQALVAFHLFWLALLLPPAGVAVWCCTKPVATIAGWTCVAVAATIMVGMLGWQTWSLLPDLMAGETTYFWQRYAFKLATAIDIPGPELMVTGAGMLVGAWFKTGRSPTEIGQAAPSDAG